jgi:hypothetical protein
LNLNTSALNATYAQLAAANAFHVFGHIHGGYGTTATEYTKFVNAE